MEGKEGRRKEEGGKGREGMEWEMEEKEGRGDKKMTET